MSSWYFHFTNEGMEAKKDYILGQCCISVTLVRIQDLNIGGIKVRSTPFLAMSLSFPVLGYKILLLPCLFLRNPSLLPWYLHEENYIIHAGGFADVWSVGSWALLKAPVWLAPSCQQAGEVFFHHCFVPLGSTALFLAETVTRAVTAIIGMEEDEVFEKFYCSSVIIRGMIPVPSILVWLHLGATSNYWCGFRSMPLLCLYRPGRITVLPLLCSLN